MTSDEDQIIRKHKRTKAWIDLCQMRKHITLDKATDEEKDFFMRGFNAGYTARE